MHWPRQHGMVAAGRPACVCRGSVGRFLAGGSFARALLLLGLGGLVGAKAVQRPCSRTRPEPAPEFPGESRCASALHRGTVEPCSTATYATDPTSTSEFMH